MEVKAGQRRQFRKSGKIFTVIGEKESPCKWLWVIKNELNGEEETHENHIIVCFSDLIEEEVV